MKYISFHCSWDDRYSHFTFLYCYLLSDYIHMCGRCCVLVEVSVVSLSSNNEDAKCARSPKPKRCLETLV